MLQYVCYSTGERVLETRKEAWEVKLSVLEDNNMERVSFCVCRRLEIGKSSDLRLIHGEKEVRYA